jgi:hypothetical protein
VPFELDRLELSGDDRRLLRHHNLRRFDAELAEQQAQEKSFAVPSLRPTIFPFSDLIVYVNIAI